MGIFSNRCEALVNPITGKALYGAALEEARQNPNWPRCGHSVKKTAHTCSACGAPAPGGWWRCPACGKWVGNDSKFCPYCNAPLYPDERSAIAGGIWHKTPEIFAQRFEVENISRITDNGLQVQEGTSAILLDAGAVKDVLDAGRYNLESIARKINWFNNPPPRSVVLLDSGEIALPIAFDNVMTKAYETVKFYGEVIVRFVGGKEAAGNFVSNVLKDKRSLTFADIVDRLDPLFRLAVQDICSESTLQELAFDAERRIKLRDTITRVLEDDLRATGLDVVRVSAGEFTNPEHERKLKELAEQEKQRQLAELEQRRDIDDHEKEKRRQELELLKASDFLDIRRQQADFEAEQRAFEQAQMLGRYKDEQSLRRAKAALEDEYNLKEIERKDNWKRLMEHRADEDMTHQRERERAERAYKEQEEEEARQKAKIQLAREEKEREEALIRRKAALDRQWELTDKESARVREVEIRHFQEAEERRARRWDAVKVEAQRLWDKKKEEWRQEDERRERERQSELEDVSHRLKVDEIQTDASIAKRIKIGDALNAELIKKAQTDVAIKKLLSDGENQAIVDRARAEAARKHIEHIEKLGETKDWNAVASEEDQKLRAELATLQTRADKLRADMENASKDWTLDLIQQEYDRVMKRMDDINKELGT